MVGALDLSDFGLGPDDVLNGISNELGFAEGDLLVACGSLAEGLGNKKSDLDLCLLTERAPLKPDPSANRAVVIGGRLVSDVLFVHPDAVRELGGKLGALYAGKRDLRAAAKLFTYFEHRLMHRLSNCVILQPSHDAIERCRSVAGLIPSHLLGRLKLDRAHYEASALQLDLAGLRDEAQWASMIFASQEILGWAIDGLLGAHGFTNPTPKWRIKLLEYLEESSIGLLPGFAARSPVELVLELNRAPAIATRESAGAYALRIIGFSRAVFFWGEKAVAGAQTVPNFASPPLAGDDVQDLLPALDIDVDFKPANGGFDLIRKNRPEGRLHLRSEEAALACIFNGTTTAAQARRGLRERDGHFLSATIIESLSALLEGAQLVQRPSLDVPTISEAIELAFDSSAPSEGRRNLGSQFSSEIERLNIERKTA